MMGGGHFDGDDMSKIKNNTIIGGDDGGYMFDDAMLR
jgi:hypothetical protein